MNELNIIFNNPVQTIKFFQPYRAAIQLVKTKLEALDDEMKCSFEHNPIHDIKTRVKSPLSIMTKLERKGLPLTIDSFYTLHDIAGLRVICHYINDIHYVAQLLIMHEDINLVDKKNYIQYPKDNGYRSLHLIVKVPVYQKSGVVEIPIEIQIRTIAMDCWASLEHEMHYKGPCEISKEMYERLKQCAISMAKTDLEMQKIYQILNREWSKI